MKDNFRQYDLEERTLVFAENVIELCRRIEQNIITKSLISQLVRSGTSIGANYREANGASSRKDFRNKIYICKKEAQETRYWLRLLLKAASPDKREPIICLGKEVMELILIFQKIGKSLDDKTKIEN